MKKILTLLLTLTIVLSLFTGFGNVLAAKEPAAEGEDIVSICLEEDWRVYPDTANIGEKYEWFKGFIGAGKSETIPFETSAQTYTDVVWFGNTFTPELCLNDSERVIIEFEGLQYYTKVWLNGAYIGDHEGSYGPFSFDITDYIKEGEENLIAVRCLAPKSTELHKGMSGNMLPLWIGGFQHIQTPVYIKVVPQVSIEDTYVNTIYETGDINIELTLNNPGNKPVKVDIAAAVKASDSNYNIDTVTKSIKIQPGEAAIKLGLKVEDFIAWHVDNPYLYDVAVEICDTQTGYTEKSVIATGFKEFYIDDGGYFVLNGERILLKSTHTTPYVVGSVDVGDDIARQHHQLDYLKSIGNNVVRFISGPALPEMLDYCDRIGLIVYQETAIAWQQVDGPITPEVFQREVEQLLLRDRSHVSFGIIGMLNETYGKNETSVRYQTALNSLELIRSMDEEILVLLSSGRWDYDNTIASACNPGSTTWDGYMGNEGEALEDAQNETFASSFKGMGDIHFYPSLPYDSSVGNLYRAIGDIRASFVSEAGAGSQANIVADYNTIKQENNKNVNDGMNQAISGQIDTFRYVYDNYGMFNIYPRLESFLLESQATQSQHRGLIADYIRSNAKINGYSVTQGSDVGYRGEGILEESMGHKEDMFDTMSDAWAPLRWCINITHYNIYNDQPLELDITLSDLGVLEEKEYKGVIQIAGETGTVFEKEVTFTPDGSFAFEVFKENVDVSTFPTGEYKVSCVVYGEEAGASTKSFWVTQRSDMPKVNVSRDIYAYDVPEALLNVLESYGVKVKQMDKENIPQNAIILLGHNNTSSRTLDPIFESVEKSGSHCIGIKWGVYGDYYEICTPFEEKFVISSPPNWLYHADSVMFETDVTSGLMTDTLVNQIYYESVNDPHSYYTDRLPEEIHSFNMFIGNDGGATAQAMTYGITCGSYAHGSGTITLNAYDLEAGAGYPVADRLILNLINYKG